MLGANSADGDAVPELPAWRVPLDSSGVALVAIAAVWHSNVNERETIGPADPFEVKPNGLLRPRGFAPARESRSLGGWFPRVCSRVTKRRIASDLADPRLLSGPRPARAAVRGSSSQPATEQTSCVNLRVR